MKIRTDFVTNSSSSSFIIARTNECTVDEIKDNLYKFRKEIVNLLEEFDEDTEDSDIENFVDSLANILYKAPGDLTLGEWKASAMECSNEDESLYAFIYDYGYKLGTKHFKVG